MNKIKNLAYLFATMMESDGKVSTKELNSWYQIEEMEKRTKRASRGCFKKFVV